MIKVERLLHITDPGRLLARLSVGDLQADQPVPLTHHHTWVTGRRELKRTQPAVLIFDTHIPPVYTKPNLHTDVNFVHRAKPAANTEYVDLKKTWALCCRSCTIMDVTVSCTALVHMTVHLLTTHLSCLCSHITYQEIAPASSRGFKHIVPFLDIFDWVSNYRFHLVSSPSPVLGWTQRNQMFWNVPSSHNLRFPVLVLYLENYTSLLSYNSVYYDIIIYFYISWCSLIYFLQICNCPRCCSCPLWRILLSSLQSRFAVSVDSLVTETLGLSSVGKRGSCCICMCCMDSWVGVNNRWLSSRAGAAASSLCAEPWTHKSKVSEFLSSSEYLRDCVMAAGGRVTQHEERPTDSKTKTQLIQPWTKTLVLQWNLQMSA